MADVNNLSVISGTNSQRPANLIQSNDTNNELVHMDDPKPYLLEECTRQQITTSVNCLIEKLYETTNQYRDVTKLELIGSLVYILMLETGYTPVMNTAHDFTDINEKFSGDVSFNINRMNIFCQYARNWKTISSNCIEMHFFLKPCQETFNVIVSMTTFGTGITLNLIIMNNITRELEHLFPYFISTVKYILNQTAPINRKFNNLKELSIDFKNKVAFPAKCTILNTDYKKHACLQYLPYELHLQLCRYFDMKTFLRYVQTCKHLNQICKDQNVWRCFCSRLNKTKYQSCVEKEKEQGESVDWRKICKQLDSSEKLIGRLSHGGSYFY